jgi:hypothetical protein
MLTPGLKNLGNQINEWAPDRFGDSDGAVGDYAHTQEDSGHNPDDTSHHNAEWDGDKDNKPEIRAIDVDIDFNNGSNAQALVDHIVGLRPSSVLRYVIYNKRIYRATSGWPTKGEVYDGPSAHTEHVHFSGAYSDASDENTSYNYKLEEIPVALTAADKQWLLETVVDAVEAAVWNHMELDPLSTATPQGSGRTGGWVRMMEKRRFDMQADLEAKLDGIMAAVTPKA